MSIVDLQSKDHRDLLDIIDKLREQGISKYVDLPQIIVVGDQSSGKSSVLEAISKMTFPVKDNLCTRFATELILRRDAVESIKISIIPGPDRTPQEKERLATWGMNSNRDLDMGAAVESAREAMGICDAKVLATDILRIEMSGPEQPHLTLVDLPGIFRAGYRDQSVNDAAIVRAIVTGYMKKERSIITAVVSAKSDFALQEITQMARELDPNGERTLGLITKPDTLDRGSDSEQLYFKLIKNEDVHFRLGWHVLRNRSYATKDYTSEERDIDEEDFFSSGIWHGADPKILGVKTLVPRLSNVLKDQILLQLPSLIQDIYSGINQCDDRLSKLGIPRVTVHEQRQYLLAVSQDFSDLMKGAVNGTYNNAFFGRALEQQGYERRLRAVVQNTLTLFTEKMCANGEQQHIVEASDKPLKKSQISRADYLKQVKLLMEHSKGCELPGTFNPLIIGELFSEQCRPWKNIAEQTKNNILKAVTVVVLALLEHIAIEETASEIYNVVNNSLEKLKKNLSDKIAEILEPHIRGHPITYNHYLTNTVQKLQGRRQEKELQAVLKQWADVEATRSRRRESPSAWDDRNTVPVPAARPPVQSSLLDMLKRQTQKDMAQYAAELATDYMQAYYKVARKRFIDDISVLAIEQCLLSKLPDLFTPNAVHALGTEQITIIAGESKDNAEERARLTEKAKILKDALSILKRLDKHKGALFENTVDDDIEMMDRGGLDVDMDDEDEDDEDDA